MPKNELSIFDNNQVPDHIRAVSDTTESNITTSGRADTLTFKGKVWTVTNAGDKQTLMRKNDEGEDEVRQIVPVVILGYAARRGRSFYKGAWDPQNPSAPDCWSADGIAPDPSSPDLQSDKCATCPQSAKGSKVTDKGVETKACGEHKYVAVALYRKWDIPPLRMKLAITSLWDAKNKAQEEKGWYAFDQYCTMLRARGVKHTAWVVTYMKFDENEAFPKVLFKAAQWIKDEDELAQVTELAKADVISDILNPTFTDLEAMASGSKGKTTKALPVEDPEEDAPRAAKPKPAAAATMTKAERQAESAAALKAQRAKVVEPVVQVDENGDPVDEGEETLEGEVVNEGGEEATDVSDMVEATEEDDEEIAVREAEEKAQALRAKIAARKAAEADAAAKAAKARKAAPAEAEEGDEDGTVVITPPVKPKGVTAAPKGGAVASPGKVTAGKGAAPKGTPAGKPASVSKEVADVIDDW